MSDERLYIDNVLIPTSGSLGVSLTKAFQDISEPNKRKGTFSKTVTLPDSKPIRKVLDHVFNLNISNRSFNPNVKVDCRYFHGGNEVITGYFQLKAVNIIDERKYEYACAIFGELDNFFQDLGDSYLDELDLSEFDHDLTLTNIIDSWDNQIQQNGVAVPFALGKGYVYPTIDFGTNSDIRNFNVTDYSPAIYIKEYWDKIFSSIGRTFSSTLLSSERFRRLILPTSPRNYVLNSSELADRSFTANTPELENGGTTTNNLPKESISAASVIKNTNEITDTGGVYDPATGIFTCVDAGIYTFEFNCTINCTLTPDQPTANVYTSSDVIGFLRLQKNTTQVVSSQSFVIVQSDPNNLNPSVGVRSTETNPSPSTQRQYVDSPVWSEKTPTTPAGVIEPRGYNPPNQYKVLATNVEMFPGDTIAPYWNAGFFARTVNNGIKSYFSPPSELFNVDGEAQINFINSSFYSKQENTNAIDGNEIKINRLLPRIKQADFIMAFVKMFNLVIEPQKDNPRNLIIEPLDDYYSTTEKLDIQDKIDNSKTLIQDILTDMNPDRYLFTYKKDSDYYNELYFDSWDGDIYGQAEVDVLNDFNVKENKEELLFSPTPSVALTGSTMVIPAIKQFDDNGNPVSTDFNYRILTYGGLKTTNRIFSISQKTSSSNTQTVVFSEYPYSGHFDDPYNPTFDLNFSLTKQIYYDSTPENTVVVTTNNLFNTYHYNKINQFNDPEARIVTCYVNMTTEDWDNFTFDKLYFFNDNYWRLYKIDGFNPDNGATTKCQFLKELNVRFALGSTVNVTGSIEAIPNDPSGFENIISLDIQTPATPNVTIWQDDNVNLGTSGTISGTGNYVSQGVGNYQIIGDGNQIFQDAQDIVLTNSNNNIIESGVTGVTLIDTDGVTVTESGSIYIGGTLVDGESIGDHQSGYKTIEEGETITISENKQMTSWNALKIDGTLNIDGDLILR